MKTEFYDIFRGEHPETDIEIPKKKRLYIDSPVMCLQTGKVYKTARAAEIDLGITRGGISHHLNGRKKRLNYQYTFIRF